MLTKAEIIEQYEAFNQWVGSLKEMEDALWLQPTAPTKWSVEENLAHLMFWNRFILEERLPHIAPGAQLVSKVDGELKNAQASQYARSGISKVELLSEWLAVGQQLVDTLRNIPEEHYLTDYQINQKSMNLSIYLESMLQHDKHHQQQIDSFLQQQQTV